MTKRTKDAKDDDANHHKEYLSDTGNVLGALSFFFSMPHINRYSPESDGYTLFKLRCTPILAAYPFGIGSHSHCEVCSCWLPCLTAGVKRVS